MQSTQAAAGYTGGPIEEGRRNATLSRIAGRLVKRYGVTEQSYSMFLNQAERCSPPLPDKELSTIWGSARRFASKVQAQPGYVPPELYDPFGELSLRPEDYSDIGQAKVLAAELAGELAYHTGTGYLCYNGKYWEPSEVKAHAHTFRFLDRQMEEASANLEGARAALLASGVSEALLRTSGKSIVRMLTKTQLPLYEAYVSALEYQRFALQRQNIPLIRSALRLAEPMLEMEITDFDSDENLLNTPSGTWDLRTGERHDHDFSDYITQMTAFAPGEEGRELWASALDTIFCSDADLIAYVQQLVGLAAIGAVYQEAMIIAYGDGSNGKSTFWNTISAALGTYSGKISADSLTVGCRHNVRPELAEVRGKRLLIASELEEGMRLSTSVVKQLCSTDEISAEKKYHDPFKFRPSHMLVLYTNHLPKVGASDSGTWRRLKVIPFNAVITGNDDIKNYSKYLLEHAGPAIMQWIIDGAKAVIAANYMPEIPDSVRNAIRAYRDENDWLSHFLDDSCEIAPEHSVKSGEIFSAYRAHCARTGEYPRSHADFTRALEQRGFTRHKYKSGVIVYGLTLRDEDAEF